MTGIIFAKTAQRTRRREDKNSTSGSSYCNQTLTSVTTLLLLQTAIMTITRAASVDAFAGMANISNNNGAAVKTSLTQHRRHHTSVGCNLDEHRIYNAFEHPKLQAFLTRSSSNTALASATGSGGGRPRSGSAHLNYQAQDHTTAEYLEEHYDAKLQMPPVEEPEHAGLMYTSEECGLDEAPESFAMSHHVLEEEIAEHVEGLIGQEEELLHHPVEHVEDSIISSWEPDTANLILEMMEQKKAQHNANYQDKPFMVGIVGIPGSGKTTSCTVLASLLGDKSLIIPMDGYHHSLSTLAKFPNPKEAIYRRGAPDTFDPASLQQDLEKITSSSSSDQTHEQVHFPGFDHEIGDPEPDAHTFTRGSHEVVICEGIYLLHDNHGWDVVKSNFDFTIYIDANVDFCVDRLKVRNACIPGYTPEEIWERCDKVDRVNAKTVEQSKKHAHHVVVSAFGQSPVPV
jgi:pantothenate kinase